MTLNNCTTQESSSKPSLTPLSKISENEVAKSDDSPPEVRHSPMKRVVLGLVRSQPLTTFSNTINEKMNLNYSKTLSILPKKRSSDVGDRFVNPYYTCPTSATKIDFYESDLYTYYDELIHGIVNAPKEWNQREEQTRKRRIPSSRGSATN